MLEFNQIIDLWSHKDKKNSQLVDFFLSDKSKGQRYLLGRTEEAIALSQIIDIDMFIDDFIENDSFFMNKPVIKSTQLTNYDNALIVNCVLNAKPRVAVNKFTKYSDISILKYSDFYRAYPEIFPIPNFVKETREDIKKNHLKWQKIEGILSDDVSKKVLNDIIQYRLTGDYDYMKSYNFCPHEQYFEDFLRLPINTVFVDAGGYDGDTTKEFCNRYPRYKKVFLFEPSLQNIDKARKQLGSLQSIEFIEKGLSDSIGKLFFDSDKGSACFISENGKQQINVTTLDIEVTDQVDLIKMDLEGWELKALAGSKRHIAEEYPALAISVYHHPSDFWRIYEYISSIRKDYNIYLRHYTESWTESIMYFVPKSS